MKLIRYICLAVVALFFLCSAGGYFYFKQKYKAPPNQLEIPAGNFQVPFTWKADTLSNTLEPYAGMFLPVTMPGCSKTFYMQFDLGAPYSLFYEGKLKAITEKTAAINIKEGENGKHLKDFGFKVGKMPLKAKEIRIVAHGSPGIDWADTAGVEIIGTIGADLIDKKVLVLNYPQAFIQLSDKMPAAIAEQAKFTDLTFDERRVILPAILNNQKTQVLFDSGSSAFELLTDKPTWEELAKKGADAQAYDVNSWGSTLTVHSVASDKSISFGATTLPLQHVHYTEGASFMQRALMQFSGMAGMIGNKLFLEKVIVLDTQHLRFGIVE